MFRWLLLGAVLLAVVSGLALGVLNPEPVTLNLAFAEFQLSLGAALAAAVACGVFAGLILAAVLFVVPGRLGRRSGRSGGTGDARNA